MKALEDKGAYGLQQDIRSLIDNATTMLEAELMSVEGPGAESKVQQKMEPLTGTVIVNDETEVIDLSTIESSNDSGKAWNTVMDQQELTSVAVKDLSGSKKSANEVFQFISRRITAGRLTCLDFENWRGAASEIR